MGYDQTAKPGRQLAPGVVIDAGGHVGSYGGKGQPNDLPLQEVTGVTVTRLPQQLTGAGEHHNSERDQGEHTANEYGCYGLPHTVFLPDVYPAVKGNRNSIGTMASGFRLKKTGHLNGVACSK